MKVQISAEKALQLVNQLKQERDRLKSFIETCNKTIKEHIDEKMKTVKWWKLYWCERDHDYWLERLSHNPWRYSRYDNACYALELTEELGDYNSTYDDYYKLRLLIKQLSACALVGNPLTLGAEEATLIAKYIKES